jgi:hypothetical protein
MFRTAVARRKKQTIEVYVFSTPNSVRVPIALEKLGLTVSASGPRGYSDYPALQHATAKALVLEAFDTAHRSTKRRISDDRGQEPPVDFERSSRRQADWE